MNILWQERKDESVRQFFFPLTGFRGGRVTGGGGMFSFPFLIDGMWLKVDDY